MRTWDTFFADVLPDTPGCPEPTVERHLLRAARRFCEGTGCWRADLTAITTRAATARYTIVYPDDADGVKLVDATLDGRQIGVEVTDGTSAAERRRGTAGERRVLTQDLRTVLVMPTPPADLSLVLTAWLQPCNDAAGVPDDIGERYLTEIATGALATLLKINKAPWANPGLAVDKEAEFREHIAKVKSAVWKAHSNARPRMRAQWF